MNKTYRLGRAREVFEELLLFDQAFDHGGAVCIVRCKRSLGCGGASSIARNFE